MSAQERVIEWGKSGRGALGAAVMLSLGPDEAGQQWKIELAIDADPLPTRVTFSPDGAAPLTTELAETETPGGFIAYATFTAPLVKSARVEIFSASGQRVEALCFQASLETGMTAKLTAEADRASLAVPPPAVAPPAAPASRPYVHPLQARLYGEAPPPPLPPIESAPSRAPEVPPSRAPEPPRPAPTETVASPPPVPTPAEPVDPGSSADGKRSLRSLRSLLDAKDAPPGAPPGPVNPPSSAVAPAASRAGPPTPPPGAPWSFANQPGETAAAPPRASLRGEPPAIQSTLTGRLGSPASRVAGPPTPPPAPPPPVANAGFDAPARKRQADRQGRNEWPRSLGEPGPTLGPKSPIDGTPILSLVEVTKEGSAAVLEIALDDQGLVSSLTIARNGLELAHASPRRLTAVSPARVKLTVPDATPPLVLIARNTYNEAFTELVAGVDLGSKQFKPFQPNPDIWSGMLEFAAPLDMDTTACVACRAEIKISQNAPWTAFAPEDREELRAQFPLTPDARALCRKCHEELVLSQRLLYRLGQVFSSRGLYALVTRLVFCYLGALAVLTDPGAKLGQVLSSTLSGPAEDWLSYDLSALIFALAIGTLPWPDFITSFAEGWRTYLKGRRSSNLAPFLVPLAVGALVYFGTTHKAAMPLWYMKWFYLGHVHGVAWIAVTVATVVSVLFQRAVDREALARLVPHRRVMQLGKAGLLLPELFRVTSRTAYERDVDRLLIDGLGALEFQVFARDRSGGSRLSLTRSVGRFRSQLAHLNFDAGDPHILGQCAKLGYPISSDDLGPGQLIEPERLQMKIPFVVCIPVWATGRVVEIYCVSRVRSTAVAEDVKGLAEVIALSAGRCLNHLLTEDQA